MDSRPLAFIARACGGQLCSGSADCMVLRVCTDSRQARPGDLFVPLPGERFDGHEFIGEAAAKGAVAVVCATTKVPVNLPKSALLVVEDTCKAFGQLAAAYRREFSIPLTAVGGSNGKTTTKELVASVLSQKFKTLSSEASFNNHIGVPTTLLRLEAGHQAAILEVGTNHPGELALLLRMIQPKYGVITNIGREHLEFFGDVAGVAREEGVVAELLPENGKLFLNGDDPWSRALAQRCAAPVCTVGLGQGNQWRARDLRTDRDGITFCVDEPTANYSGEYRLNLLGRHQVVNALYALALGAELGVPPAAAKTGVAACKPARMRLQSWDLNGVRVLDDAYNANADSMLAALQTLQELPCKGRRVAVLGQMAELGRGSEAAHEEVGRRVAELGIGQLFAVGPMASVLARGARQAGLTRVLEFPDIESAAAAVKSFLRSGDVVLLKASRVARLERLAEFLRSN